MNAAIKPSKDYLVKDLSLADWGRKEIKIAETEMPGLMAIRRRIRGAAAAARRAHHRLPAHDHSNGGADRDLERPGRAGALGLVQYLFDPGSCGRGHRRRRHAGVRGQGRVAGGVLGLHPPHFRVAGRRSFEHDPGRRRRCHAAAAPGRPRGKRRLPDRQARQRGGAMPVRRHQGQAQRGSEVVFDPPGQDQGRHRGNHHRRQAPVSNGQGRRSSPSRHSTSTIRSPSPNSTTYTVAASPWWMPSSAPPT